MQGIILGMLSKASTFSLFSGISAASGAISRWFPVPSLLFPRAAGVDISDTSLKWIVLETRRGGTEVRSYGNVELTAGIVVNGIVEDPAALGDAISAVASRWDGVECAHAALPEEAAYVFSMHIPHDSSRERIRSIIEFELEGRVPISPSAAIFDFDMISREAGAEDEISVYVFPRELAASYADAFLHSSVRLLSLELESRSAARAVSSGRPDEPITLLVDFGRLRTGLAVLKRGIPIFTSTVMRGGDMIDPTLGEKLPLTPQALAHFKNEEGLLLQEGKNSAGRVAISGVASALADEITRHHHYWDTRRNERGERVTPVEQVYLIGGSANLKGLGDHIAARVQADVARPNVWQHVCSFDDYIPPLDRRVSLEYATAIGLALRSA